MGRRLDAQAAFNTLDGHHVAGRFTGDLDVSTAQFNGTIDGMIQFNRFKEPEHLRVHVKGCLRPDRTINIGQYHRGQPLGGVTLQVQVPLPTGICFQELAPTDTFVAPERGKHPRRPRLEEAKELIDCLNIWSNEPYGIIDKIFALALPQKVTK